MAVNSRESLKQYALRALGAPVIEINVDDDQLEDRLDEALEFWRQYHYDGIERMYFKYQITQTDIDNKYIPIPDLIYGITRVIPITQTSGSKNMFDMQYQLRLHDLYDLTSVSIIYFKNVMSHIALLDMELNGPQSYRFNRLQGRLMLDIDWNSEVKDGSFIVVEAYRVLDPNEFTKVWSEMWLKHYVTALFKKQWGANMKKFGGIQLPGGVTLNGQETYDEGITEIKELEDELMNKSAPLDMFIG